MAKRMISRLRVCALIILPMFVGLSFFRPPTTPLVKWRGSLRNQFLPLQGAIKAQVNTTFSVADQVEGAKTARIARLGASALNSTSSAGAAKGSLLAARPRPFVSLQQNSSAPPPPPPRSKEVSQAPTVKGAPQSAKDATFALAVKQKQLANETARQLSTQESTERTGNSPWKVHQRGGLKSRDGANNLQKGRKVLVFTMDSLQGKQVEASKGGAMGEALVRRPLVLKLEQLGFTVHTCTSDKEFDRELADTSYQLFVLDPWTWAKKGFVPKGRLATQAGIGRNTFILDFFGNSWQTAKAVSIPGFDPKTNALAMFPSHADFAHDPSFLGFGVQTPSDFWGTASDDASEFSSLLQQKQQTNEILVWAKDPQYLMVGAQGGSQTPPRLDYVVSFCEAYAALTADKKSTLVFSFSRDRSDFSQRLARRTEASSCAARFQGHSAPDAWRQLLRKVVAVLGVVDPLSGPTAIEGLIAGALYVNPRIDPSRKAWAPKEDKGSAHSSSQHTFLERYFERNGGEEHRICTVKAWDAADVKRCAAAAATRLTLTGESARALFQVPLPFTSEEYSKRVSRMFGKPGPVEANLRDR